MAIIFRILALCLLSILAFGAPSHAENAAEPIRIGSILILTGEGAATGNASRNGIELAVEKVNADGGLLGRPLAVEHQDDQGDPKKTVAAFQQLVEFRKIKIIIGPTWSNVGEPLIELADRKKVLTISPSLGVAKFNESSPYLFNTWPHDFVLSRALADYVFDEGRRNVALIGAEHVWVKEQTEAFKQQFEKRGGKIGYLSEPLPGTVDLQSEALKIKSTAGIDAYVSTTDGVVVGSLVAKSLKTLGVKLPSYSITLDQSAIDAAQGGFDGLEFLTFLTPSAEFKAKYEARFRTPLDIGADSAYDAVLLVADAIRATGSTDPSVLAAELAKVREYAGVSGKLVSDGKRGFTKPYATKRVVGGKPEDAK